MELEIKYKVTAIHSDTTLMTVEYQAKGLSKVSVKVPIPYAGTDMDSHVANYTPERIWAKELRQRHVIKKGYSGSYTYSSAKLLKRGSL